MQELVEIKIARGCMIRTIYQQQPTAYLKGKVTKSTAAGVLGTIFQDTFPVDCICIELYL